MFEKFVYQKMARPDFLNGTFRFCHDGHFGLEGEGPGAGGGLLWLSAVLL